MGLSQSETEWKKCEKKEQKKSWQQIRQNKMGFIDRRQWWSVATGT